MAVEHPHRLDLTTLAQRVRAALKEIEPQTAAVTREQAIRRRLRGQGLRMRRQKGRFSVARLLGGGIVLSGASLDEVEALLSSPPER